MPRVIVAAMRVEAVTPPVALPGGIIQLQLSGIGGPEGLNCTIGGVPAHIISASATRALVRVPVCDGTGIEVQQGDQKAAAGLTIGHQLADELHPVANPVVDNTGNVFVTFSGARGQEVPYGIFKVSPSGEKEPFLGDIINATGLAVGPDQRLYISSRHTGTIYRSTFDKQLEKFAEGLGLATGLAFDSSGRLFAGDRSGIIYELDEEGQATPFCELEASVAAYHLAVGEDDRLFVTGPTLATQDCVYVVSGSGEVDVFYRGLGRPQGLFFDSDGRLLVAACWRGYKGLFGLSDGPPELVVAAPTLIGGAWDSVNSLLYLVDGEALYQIAM